jgi:hypothetical protein
MRCVNCGLPLPPAQKITNCSRCGTFLTTTGQGTQQPFAQGGWDNIGREGTSAGNPWDQTISNDFAFGQQGFQKQINPQPNAVNSFNDADKLGFQAASFSPKRPYPPPRQKKNSRNLFMVAGLCVIVGALLLVLILVLGTGNSSPNTASTNSTVLQQPTAAPSVSSANASPTVGTSPLPTGTAYPAQQYINNAQMANGVDNQTLKPQQPTNTFKAGSNMYVVFDLHPPSQGGAVCTYWYLGGKQVTSYSGSVSGTSHASYAYAQYNSAGAAYVELYWASDKSCANQLLAQHVDFTVTSS